ncbi:NAD-dependent epimerase/dehydratase family protein [Lactovum odontotermitis]
MTERVLVLGANGFLGSHVVDNLIAEGFMVRAFDMYQDFDHFHFESDSRIEIFNGNFLNQNDIVQALKDVDYVIHLVSTTNPATADADPLIDIDTNIMGSVQLFQKCVSNGKIKKIIYSSSGGTVYGDRDFKKPVSELEYTWPVSPYGIGKLTIENYLHYFDKKNGQKYTAFRIANPFGERQPIFKKQGAIAIFTDAILNDSPITILGDGNMIRDYVYVRDIAKVIVKSLKKELNHSIYNLGSGDGKSVIQIVHELEKNLGKKAIIKYVPKPETYVDYSVLDIGRMKKDFAEVEITPFEEALEKFVKSLGK